MGLMTINLLEKAFATPAQPDIHYMPFVMTNTSSFAEIEDHIQELIATYGPIDPDTRYVCCNEFNLKFS
jgi:hypothetical protein